MHIYSVKWDGHTKCNFINKTKTSVAIRHYLVLLTDKISEDSKLVKLYWKVWHTCTQTNSNFINIDVVEFVRNRRKRPLLLIGLNNISSEIHICVTTMFMIVSYVRVNLNTSLSTYQIILTWLNLLAIQFNMSIDSLCVVIFSFMHYARETFESFGHEQSKNGHDISLYILLSQWLNIIYLDVVSLLICSCACLWVWKYKEEIDFSDQIYGNWPIYLTQV